MIDSLEVGGYRAMVQYDPDIDMFRGEFVGLNGDADFYAKDIDILRREGEFLLKALLEMCHDDGVDPPILLRMLVCYA